MVQKLVCHESDLVVRTLNKEPIWVRQRVLITPRIFFEVFPEGEDSLWYKIPEISRGIGATKILYVLQEFGCEVTGRGSTVEI